MAPDTHEIDGFIYRRDSSDYGRSEQSLRREFDEAVSAVEEEKEGNAEKSIKFLSRFGVRPEEFRSHFRVQTKDGTEHSGADVTKDDVKQMSDEGMKPEWYVSVELLNSRYWEKKKGGETKSSKIKKQSKKQSTLSVKLTDATELQQLQHELALTKERLVQKEETIETLEADRMFYQEELKNRRGEIDRLRGFFREIREGMKKADELNAGKNESNTTVKEGSDSSQESDQENSHPANDKSVIDATVVEDANGKEGTDRQKHSWKERADKMMDFLNRPLGSKKSNQSETISGDDN